MDLDALRRNYRRLRGVLAPDVRLLPMLKADGYGLGAVRVAGALAPLGPWGFGVATAEEGIEMRRAGLEARVVVFSPCSSTEGGVLAEHDLEPVVSSREALLELAGTARDDRPLRVHLEIDTGMGRLGVPAGRPGQWTGALARTLERRQVELSSTFTHYHSAGEDPNVTLEQRTRYHEALGAIREAGVDPGLTHAANSAAILAGHVGEEMARPGIHLYGGGGGEPAPEPVVTLRARVLDVRKLSAGATVGYGATWTAPRETRVATLGIGYGDGYRRELSDRARVVFPDGVAPVRGSVCMDVTVADVSELPAVAPGDVATLLGRCGSGEVALEEMASLCGTIEYEVLTGLGRRLPRVYRGEGGTGRREDVA